MKKKIWLWFTLVEMLIVVVIIGILATAILSRITGYLAKTRDLKRQTDTRNLAAAVQMYKDEKWEYPLRRSLWHVAGYSQRFWSVAELLGIVPDYLKELPRDPNPNTIIKLHDWPYRVFETPGYNQSDNARIYASVWRGENRKGGFILRPGDYLYQIFSKGAAAVIVAKVETPEMANYVFDGRSKKYDEWGVRKISFKNPETKNYDYNMEIDLLHLCDSIEKWDVVITATAKNRACVFSSHDQLYYIVKIE